MKPRVFVSVPDDRHLDDRRRRLKRALVGAVADLGFEVVGFEPEQFGIGAPANPDEWTVARAQALLRRCDGVLVLALARSHVRVARPNTDSAMADVITPVPSPYNHLEGALGISLGLPLLVIVEAGMDRTGILSSGTKPVIVPTDGDASWVETSSLRNFLPTWAERIRHRRDVFLGYCSKGSEVALAVRSFLEDSNYSVLDWSRDFSKAGATILDEITAASTRCRCAVFLFTRDDELAENAQGKPTFDALPRDNVLLEAGLFTAARGMERVAIIREAGAKMPADFGGIIYLGFDDRRNVAGVLEGLSDFLQNSLRVPTLSEHS